jgi:hypothetical protein
MLTNLQIIRIIRLADEGLSQRSISIATGVSRDTVRLVVQRRLKYRVRKRDESRHRAADPPTDSPPPDAQPVQPPPEATEALPDEIPRTELDPHGLYDVDQPIFHRPPERCPGCGSTCYLPCLACRLRKRARIRQR